MKFRKHLSKYSFCSYHKQDTININDSCRPRFYLLIGMTGHSLLDSDGRLNGIEIQTDVNHKKPSILLILGWEKNRKSSWIQMCFWSLSTPLSFAWMAAVVSRCICVYPVYHLINSPRWSQRDLVESKRDQWSLCSSSPTRPCPSDLYSLISYPYHIPFHFFLFLSLWGLFSPTQQRPLHMLFPRPGTPFPLLFN